MILDTILYIFLLLLLEIFDLLPAMETVPSNFDSAITTIVPIFSQLNSIIPVSTVITIFLLYLTIEGGLLVFKIFNWIINKLRGSG